MKLIFIASEAKIANLCIALWNQCVYTFTCILNISFTEEEKSVEENVETKSRSS